MPGCARLGLLLLTASSVLFIFQLIPTQTAGFVLRAVGSAIFIAIISMYIMDHVRRDQIGRSEPRRLLFIGLAWTFGPIAGVQLEVWLGPWAPFAASAVAAIILLGYFLLLRFSNAPVISADARSAPRPYHGPGCVNSWRARASMLAWLHAIGRGFVWGTFNLYAPLFAVQSGLGKQAGGVLVGVGSAFMLAMPLWGWLSRRFGIRRVSLICFPLAALGMLASGLLATSPWVAAGFLISATLAMSVIDGYGNALVPARLQTVTTHRDDADLFRSERLSPKSDTPPSSRCFSWCFPCSPCSSRPEPGPRSVSHGCR